MRSKGPIINTRYESAAQLAKFKRAAKACKWSLNTFLLVAADKYAAEILSSQAQAATQAQEEIQQSTE